MIGFFKSVGGNIVQCSAVKYSTVLHVMTCGSEVCRVVKEGGTGAGAGRAGGGQPDQAGRVLK